MPMVTRMCTLALAGVAAFLSAAPTATAQSSGDAAVAAPATARLAGANDWGCRPSAAHPRPVVLVHGTWSDAAVTWKNLAPALAAEGYCVYAIDYGRDGGLLDGNLLGMVGGADIDESARQLAEFVDRVRAATGAAQVDIVGHSQGGTLARQYLRFGGGADHANPARNAVRTLVTLGATNHGTTFGDVQVLGALAQAIGVPVIDLAGATVGPSYVQQMVGSPFLRALNAGGDTDAGIDYTVVASRDDRVSTPPAATFLTAGPGATVRNVWVQDGCQSRRVDHAALTTDPRAVHIVQVALDATYASRHAAPC